MLGIYQYPHGIMLNAPEWVLEGDADSDVAMFDTAEDAVAFLNEKTGENHDEDGWEKLGIFIGYYDEDEMGEDDET